MTPHGAAFYRHPHPDTPGALLPPGRLSCRSDPACRPGAHHARAFRPCPVRPWRCDGDAGDASRHGAAIRRRFRARDRSGAARRDDARRQRRCALCAGRPCPRLGPDRHRGRRHEGRRVGRLQALPGTDLHALELVPCDVFITEATFGPAGLPPPRRQRRNSQAPAVRRALPGADTHDRRLCPRQGAAPDGAAAAGGPWRPDLPARRPGAPDGLL